MLLHLSVYSFIIAEAEKIAKNAAPFLGWKLQLFF